MPTLLPLSDSIAVGFRDDGQPMVASKVGQPDKREARRLAHAHREQLLHQVGLLTSWLAATEEQAEERRIVMPPPGLRV